MKELKNLSMKIKNWLVGGKLVFLLMLSIMLSACVRTPITTCKVDKSLIVYDKKIEKPKGAVTNGDLIRIIRNQSVENRKDNNRKKQLLRQLKACK